ncbi:MAG: tetratricopeptide repeat protein [Deltaproteobacteria bacterium]|nr:tetratricopeptide repeat protein [Deltaproteobacteria bacterium]
MKKIGFGTRPSEVKKRGKNIDFGDTPREEPQGSYIGQIYTPRKPPGKAKSTLTFGKILLLALASMVIGILIGGFLLFDFSFDLAVDSMQLITAGRETEVKNGSSITIKYADGLKLKSIFYKGFYRFLPPKDVQVSVAGIKDTTNRFLDDLIPLLKPEERMSYDIVFTRGSADLGKITLTLDMGPQDWILRADALENKNAQAECYKKAVALNPDSHDAHNALGKLYESERKFKQAIPEYEAVLRIKPDDMQAMLSLLSLYKKTGMEEKTLDLYQKLAKADPKRADDYSSRAGAIAEKQGSDEKALAIYQTLLNKNRGNIDARQKIIKLYEKSKKWDKVIEHVKVLIDLDPKNADLYLYLSDICYKKNDIAGALAAAERAQKLRPNDSSIFVQLAVLSEKAKKNDLAIGYYQKAVKTNPKKNPTLYNNLGMLLEKKGARKEAIQNYEMAVALNSKNIAFAKNLADAYEKEQQWKKAAEMYERITVLDKGSSESLEAAAVLWYKAGDKEKSLGAYKKLAATQPKKILWHQKLAYLYEEVNKIDDAMAEYKAVLALDPANAEAKQKRVELAKRKIKSRGK